MTQKTTRRGFTQANKEVVFCPPCGESVALVTKEEQNWKKILWSLLPRLVAVLPPQGGKMSRGFTLIELLVVVLIIAILAAVALPQYNKAVKKARGTEALTVLNALDKAIQAYYLEHGTFEHLTVDTLNMDMPELKNWRYWTSGDKMSYETGTNQLTNFSIGIGVDQQGKNVTADVLLLSKDGLQLVTSWSDREPAMAIRCQTERNGISCADYFNCNANPLTFIPGPNFYSGGDCTLK